MQLKYLFVIFISLVLFSGCTQSSAQEDTSKEIENKTKESSNNEDAVTDEEPEDTEVNTSEPELLSCTNECCNDSTHVKKSALKAKSAKITCVNQ